MPARTDLILTWCFFLTSSRSVRSSYYVKVKGPTLQIYVFFDFFVNLFLETTFLPSKDKKPTSAISCSSMFKTCSCFAFSIKKSDTIIGNEFADLNPCILLFHSKNSTRKLLVTHFLSKEKTNDILSKTEHSVVSKNSLMKEMQILFCSWQKDLEIAFLRPYRTDRHQKFLCYDCDCSLRI